ncbi:dipeptide/oligopeptide/nickel ABC transporter permease/ATP-binding protein [Sinomonas sp. G460-2]|uniref:dipeptide/oligopeptide/nickel ABC transporter permease/ATP-binding protein n=1 Tax=Sinomonas sp. G460-2 TaxID=3393464 RepID=UPI0039F06742
MTEVLVETTATSAATKLAPPRRPKLVGRVLKNPLGLMASLWILLVVAVAVAGQRIAPYSPTDIDLNAIASGFTGEHLLGTDSLGRDVLSRLIVGTTPSAEGVVVAVLVFAAIGIPVGVLAGYYGGWLDAAVGRVNDIVMSLPGLILLLVVLAVFSHNQDAAMIALGILGAPGLIRVTRAVTMSVREELYIAAARVFGLTGFRILVRHVLPRIQSTAIVQLALFAAAALAVQSGLAFLGFGPQPPAPSWGGMIGDASAEIMSQPWQIVPPGLAIGLTMVAFGLLGNSIRDAVASSWSHIQSDLLRRHKPTRNTIGKPIGARGALLSVRGLCVTVVRDGVKQTVVRSVDLDIMPGETVGVVGESGCGKTLTSLGILGALPPGAQVSAGSVMLRGENLGEMTAVQRDAVRGRRIAYVSQEPALALDPMFSVGSQLREAVRRHHGLSRKEADARVLELLEMVRLPEPALISRKYPHQLSGGMAQRVGIALALSGQPELLIADEPTTALDVTTQAEILSLLAELNDETGMATLIVTHDWGVVASLCDRAVVMYAGEVAEVAPVTDVFSDPKHPYTAALLRSNPHVVLELGSDRAGEGGDIPRLPTIPGEVPAPGALGVGCAFADRCAISGAECRTGLILLESRGPNHSSRCLRPNQVNNREVVSHETA